MSYSTVYIYIIVVNQYLVIIVKDNIDLEAPHHNKKYLWMKKAYWCMSIASFATSIKPA